VSALGLNTPAGPTGSIRATDDVVSYYSDNRFKKDIKVIDNALDKVLSLTGVYFTQNKYAEKFGYNDYTRHVGVIAQQVQTFIPEIVKPAPFDVDEHGNSVTGLNFITVQYERLVPVVVQAIKEQQEELQVLLNILEDREAVE
jgi:hypothetical protein